MQQWPCLATRVRSAALVRLFVEGSIYDKFVGQVADFVRTLKVGNGADPETQIGPLVSQQQIDRVTGSLAHTGCRYEDAATPASPGGLSGKNRGGR